MERFQQILDTVSAATPDDGVDPDELDLLRRLADGANELDAVHTTVRSCVLEHYDLFNQADLDRLLNLEHMLTDALVQLRHLNAWEPFDQVTPPTTAT